MTATQKKNKTKKKKQNCVKFSNQVLQFIRQHSRSSPDMEICGVLIGQITAKTTIVEGAIAGKDAAQGGAHVTFTQETWNYIHAEKEKKYPEQLIIGWYHSHPGFGVFLSEHDLFIHENFFTDPCHIAWVFDPHSDEEGCFGWIDGEIKRLPQFEIMQNNNLQKGNQFDLQTPKLKLLKSLMHKRWLLPLSFTFNCLLLIIIIVLIFVLRNHNNEANNITNSAESARNAPLVEDKRLLQNDKPDTLKTDH
jgi:proteasome lid subunit RPN8/RPN11